MSSKGDSGILGVTLKDDGNYIVHLEGDGSEHIEYLRQCYEHIPDFMLESIAQVMSMAEKWIASQKESPR